jgi:hypothetical protein
VGVAVGVGSAVGVAVGVGSTVGVAVGVGSAVGVGPTPASDGVTAVNVRPRAKRIVFKIVERCILSPVCPGLRAVVNLSFELGQLGQHHTAEAGET